MNADLLTRTQFAKPVRARQQAQDISVMHQTLTGGMDYSFQAGESSRGDSKHAGGVIIPQSGLRHAIALEKLINSHDSDRDSAGRDL